MNQISDEENKLHEIYKITNIADNKAFLSDKLTLDQKLEKAKEYLATLNAGINNDEILDV